MHYYVFHIGDFRSSTAHLSNEEDLAYRRLIDWYYDTESPIPLSFAGVARRLRVTVEAVESVLTDFFQRTENGWINPRCEAEIAKYRSRARSNRKVAQDREANRKEAKTTIRSPVVDDSSTIRSPVVDDSSTIRSPAVSDSSTIRSPVVDDSSPVVHESPPNQEPITNNQEPLKRVETFSSPEGEATPSESEVNLPAQKPKQPKASRLTMTALPDQWREFAIAERQDLDPEKTWDRFRDYWVAQPNGRGTKADWFATWRNWVRKETTHGKTKFDHHLDAIASVYDYKRATDF